MTVVDPDFVVSCTEIAVIFTLVCDVTTGGVNTPSKEMLPALTDQVTALLKFPVPRTVALHCDVGEDPDCGSCNTAGLHDGVTEVMVDVGGGIVVDVFDPHPTNQRADSTIVIA